MTAFLSSWTSPSFPGRHKTQWNDLQIRSIEAITNCKALDSIEILAAGAKRYCRNRLVSSLERILKS
jgi:hypothetical protein